MYLGNDLFIPLLMKSKEAYAGSTLHLLYSIALKFAGLTHSLFTVFKSHTLGVFYHFGTLCIL